MDSLIVATTPSFCALLVALATASAGCATSADLDYVYTSDSRRPAGDAATDEADDPEDSVLRDAHRADTRDAADATPTSDTSTVDTASVDDSTVAIDSGPDAYASDVVRDSLDDTAGDADLTSSFFFPRTGDKLSISSSPNLWNKGDYIEGTRTPTVASATSLKGTWDIINRIEASPCGWPFPLYTGVLKVAVYLNSKNIGSFSVKSTSSSSVPVSFTFPAISGPTYTLKYLVTETVASSCGSVESKMNVSKLTLK